MTARLLGMSGEAALDSPQAAIVGAIRACVAPSGAAGSTTPHR